MAPKPKADEEPEEAAEGEEKPAAAKTSFLSKFLSKKMMIIAAAGLVVVGGGGFAAYKFLFSHGSDKHQEAATKPATFVDMPDVLVNLSNPGGDRTQYLKVKITLELPSKEAVDKINPLMPRLVDAFQTYLRELRPTDLDGSAGLYRLKEELTRRVNLAVAPNKITAVLFKEIVVQ